MSWGLILAVLAAVAVPLCLNTRKTSAARACKGNIAAIAAAESAYALRNGVYASMSLLVSSSPEGLSGTVVCPLDHQSYSGLPGTTTTSAITITCPNALLHANDLSSSTVGDWQRSMSAIGSDTQP